jgi:uncharacterized protein YdaU (DUF1376 family)
MSQRKFRSPTSKLVAFFERSRDGWRQKCKEVRKQLKSLKIRHAKLKASRDYWKRKARQSAAAPATGPEQAEARPIKTPVPAARGARSHHRRLCVAAEAGSY